MDVNNRPNEFERDYIEYLKERNEDLLNKLNLMKETYESKILSKHLNKSYLTTVLENVLNICTVFPQEIDSFFDKMTVAMSALEKILLRKSEMEQLVEKVLRAFSCPENFADVLTMNTSNFIQEQSSENRATKKAETVKVSPMINGHIISTEPKIFLNRVPAIYTGCQRDEPTQLSPIIEASPETSSEQSGLDRHIFKNLKISLERINCNKTPYNYITEESPRRRFKGPKTWKKSLFSTKNQSDNNGNSFFTENNENLNTKHSGEEAVSLLSKDVNPLEGPSWLYNNESGMNSPPPRFVDYRRRKHRFATIFNNIEDYEDYSCSEEKRKSLEDTSSKFCESHQKADNEKNAYGSTQKNVKDSSEDLFSDMFESEDDESNTSVKKEPNSERWLTESNCGNKSSEFNESIKNDFLNSSTKSNNINSMSGTLAYSDASDERDNQESSDRSLKKGKKSCKSCIETSYKRISSTNSSNHFENEVYVKLQDCMMTKKISNQSTGTPSSDEKSLKRTYQKGKKSKRQNTKHLDFSPAKNRSKRKAAPTFKMTEPKINTKLRRN